MATARWIESEKRWTLDCRIKGQRHVFHSTLEGKKGEKDVTAQRDSVRQGKEPKRNWKLSRCWADYLLEVQKNTSPENYHQRESYGRLYILPRLGGYKVSDITVGDWQDCVTQAKPVNGKPLAKKTLSNLKGTIINFCRFASEHNMIDTVPNTLRLPKNAPVVGKQIIQPDQLGLLFEDSDEWYVNAWRLMIVQGMRPGETYGLKHEDIVDGVVRISRAINWAGRITDGKPGENTKRTFLLNDYALAIIEQQKQTVKNSGIDSPWVFPEPDGDTPSQRNGYTAWKRFRAEKQLNASPYCLRHTWVSLTKVGVPEALQKHIVGHSKSMDTHGVYGHVVTGEMQQAADLTTQALQKYLKNLV